MQFADVQYGFVGAQKPFVVGGHLALAFNTGIRKLGIAASPARGDGVPYRKTKSRIHAAASRMSRSGNKHRFNSSVMTGRAMRCVLIPLAGKSARTNSREPTNANTRALIKIA